MHLVVYGDIVLKDGVPVGQLIVEDVMEHRTSTELKGLAEVIHPQKLSERERLERWALALDKCKGTRLRTLRETEYKPANEQSALRQENSADGRLRGSDSAVGRSDKRQIWRRRTFFWTFALAASRGGL